MAPITNDDQNTLGTAGEITRRRFMANAVFTVSGIIGVVLAVPIAGSLVPERAEASGTWSPLTKAELAALKSATDTPVKMAFSERYTDAYLPEESTEDYVWGIKVDPARFRAARPDLLDEQSDAATPYPVVNMGFVIFSPLCPHLGGRYNWIASERIFRCPIHGSTFTFEGAHLGGPAPRGLDPLPFREHRGIAEIMWIQYASTTPTRIVVSYRV